MPSYPTTGTRISIAVIFFSHRHEYCISAIEYNSAAQCRSVLVVLPVCKGISVYINSASNIHSEDNVALVCGVFAPAESVRVSNNSTHSLLYCGVKRSFFTHAVDTVLVQNVVYDKFICYFPRFRQMQ